MEVASATAAVSDTEVDFRRVFESSPASMLVLKPDPPRWTIVAATDSFLQLTHKERETLIGQALFEQFPDNTALGSDGRAKLSASLELVAREGKPDWLPVQHYNIQVDGEFRPGYYSACNQPVFGAQGELLYIVHRSEDVSEFVLHSEKPRVEELERTAEAMRYDSVRQSKCVMEMNESLRATNERLERALTAAETANKVKADFLANVRAPERW